MIRKSGIGNIMLSFYSSLQRIFLRISEGVGKKKEGKIRKENR